MKFAILSDIHLWPEGTRKGIVRKLNQNVLTLLDDFVKEIQTIQPEFLVILGDLIEHENEEKDKERLTFLYNKFQDLPLPVYYVIGNHDIIYLPEEQVAEALHLDNPYYSFEISEYIYGIVLFPKRALWEKKILISDEQQQRLKNELKTTKKQCIIFVHHWLADQDLTNNPRFEGLENACLIEERESIREIIAKSWKVVAVFNGHLHRNHLDIHDNIPYYTIQSFTENEDDKGIPSEAYAIVDIEASSSKVNILGNYPKELSYHQS